MVIDKKDSGKERMDLVDPDFVLGVGKVMTYGMNKYGKNTWQSIDDAKARYFAACMRHLLRWQSGEKYDKDSGLSHLHHAAANIMFLTVLFEVKNEK